MVMPAVKYLDNDLNLRLVALLKKTGVRHSVDEKGVVRYSSKDEEAVENELISSIRTDLFPSWQVLTCPKGWVGRYKSYMTRHGIPFREEMHDGTLWFLLPGKYRPHRWKLDADPAAVAG
jgi:hypothetical protein